MPIKWTQTVSSSSFWTFSSLVEVTLRGSRTCTHKGASEGVGKRLAWWPPKLYVRHVQILTRLCSCSSSSSSCCVSSEENLNRHPSPPPAWHDGRGRCLLGSANPDGFNLRSCAARSSHPRVFLLLLSLPLQALLLPLLLLLLLAVRLERRSVHVVAGDAKRCAKTIVLLLVGRSQSVSLCHPATSN